MGVRFRVMVLKERKKERKKKERKKQPKTISFLTLFVRLKNCYYNC
jgi:hypothetical protein